MLPWNAIDTIMFDMDGTLLDLHFDNYFWQVLVPRAFAERHGLGEAAARDAVARKYQAVAGTLRWYCLDHWTRELQLDIMGLKHAARARIRPLPQVPATLARLQGSGKRLLLVTNAHPDSMALKLHETGLAKYFHRRVSSHPLGKAKENPGFWLALRQVEDYDPRGTLLIDDSLPVLRNACREGIRHLYAVRQPDSMAAPVARGEFPQLGNFASLFGTLPTAADSATAAATHG